MGKVNYSVEQIITVLRKVEIMVGQGGSILGVCRTLDLNRSGIRYVAIIKNDDDYIKKRNNKTCNKLW